MRLLFVARLAPNVRSVCTIDKYVKVGKALGHEVAVFGEPHPDLPELRTSLEVRSFDCAVFVVHGVWDFPDMPHLAHLLDGVPKARRVVIDCWGRYNETVRVEHDFNHLEKVDGHQGWEWTEALRAISDTILQPALQPRRPDVYSFLFHGFDPDDVRPMPAASTWSGGLGEAGGEAARPYGLVYVGNNWQRWTQLRPALQAAARLKAEWGPSCLAGWDWEKPPAWAAQLGVRGAEVDPAFLRRLGVVTRPPVPYRGVTAFLGQGRVSPVVHRPLFNHLGIVTNRTFETFCADVIPLVLLPREIAAAIYGPAAGLLVPGDDLAAHLAAVCRDPEPYWGAVRRTRTHLAEHHSFRRRFEELLAILGHRVPV
ncbi:MAG: hypothetical protein ACRDI2_14450 [Chloroflexota bacterium]